jgi:putative ABC transport system substrate-binding protein
MTTRSSRRALLLGLAAAALGAPRLSNAQTAGRIPRIVIFTGRPATKESVVAGLRDLGWVEGQNVVIEVRLGEAIEGTVLRTELLDVVRRPVEVLVMGGPHRIRVAMNVTKTIPIVGIDLESDPVASGFVKSLARPGTNVSGIWMDLPELAGKQLQFLREIVPTLSRVGVVWDERIGGPQFAQAQAAARASHIRLHAVTLHHSAEADDAVKRLLVERPQAILLLTAPAISQALPRLAELARQRRLPSISLFSTYPASGGLIAYGPDFVALYRQTASYVDRILKRAKIGDLPVERPTKFVLNINVKTAKALGLTIPPSLLLRADQVIE